MDLYLYMYINVQNLRRKRDLKKQPKATSPIYERIKSYFFKKLDRLIVFRLETYYLLENSF